MNEKDGAIRDASVLGVPKMLILGLQHMFAMFGATILVPILVNSYFGEDVLHVQVTLICAGIGTLFFHLCSKFKVPAFLGSSFAFLGGFATIANMDSGVFADMSNADKLSYACGGIVVAGLLYLILALIIKLVGVKKVMRFLPPVVTGPIIICIGLSLAGSAINNASIFPISNWTEKDIWQYIKRENIEIVPLYFAKERPVIYRDGNIIMVDDDRLKLREGEKIENKKVRFRTLGCYPLTGGVESDAETLDEIIEETLSAVSSERTSRVIDHEEAGSMERRKKEGYF